MAGHIHCHRWRIRGCRKGLSVRTVPCTDWLLSEKLGSPSQQHVSACKSCLCTQNTLCSDRTSTASEFCLCQVVHFLNISSLFLLWVFPLSLLLPLSLVCLGRGQRHQLILLSVPWELLSLVFSLQSVGCFLGDALIFPTKGPSMSTAMSLAALYCYAAYAGYNRSQWGMYFCETSVFHRFWVLLLMLGICL